MKILALALMEMSNCPYAHRNAGDTERRYHPRYFKTGNCIYETTEIGACVKNGLHCAFAHGPDDLRLPVYDIREVQDATSSKVTVNLPASLEKERVLSEDPTWNDMLHVMARYKTESCRKPPRMCRQGYSCPYYHNGKDKRRMPDRCYYRSTPCPVVRPADEWLDSSLCEAGDSCTYCHTRTEQQFHPEIYKSTKCNDVLSSGYCPRGPFCAFAHSDSEMTLGRNFIQSAATQQQAGLPPSSSSRQQNASPVSSSTSASSSGIFSPAIRPLQCPSRVSPASAAAVPPVGGLYATQTYPSSKPSLPFPPSQLTICLFDHFHPHQNASTSRFASLRSLKLRMRHRSGGTEGLGVTASPFDQSESTPPPLSLSQPSVISAFPIFSPAGFGRSGFVGQQTSMLSSSSTTTTATTKSPPFASTTDPIQPRTTAAQQSRKKLPADTSKFSRMRLESAGALLENYARGLAVTTPTTTQQQQQLLQSQLLQSQQRSTGRCLTKVQPRQPAQSPTVASTPTTSAPKTPTSAFQSAPWWFADPPQQSRSVEAEQHNLDNEYLNSLITDELRTQLTINTSTEDLHHHQFFKLNGLQSLTQSPLSCLLRQMQLSTQVAPTNVTTKRGSGLFDDNPMGGVISSPLSSPPGVTLPSGTTTSAAPLTTSSVIDQPLVGCQSAPVCIPTNGNRVCGGGIFDLPCRLLVLLYFLKPKSITRRAVIVLRDVCCTITTTATTCSLVTMSVAFSCGCCRNRGGQDSAFNSGGTPTVVCEFGAVGSTSLQSGTSEGQDSALALSEAKDDEPLSGAFGSGSGGGGSSSTGLGSMVRGCKIFTETFPTHYLSVFFYG
ncbi:unnamed protein product [Mesocestoides corti]|uniref:C3H1-type domain-containing protein n=1 Tax=Mesocestoides corti TaxID=53468 RepID=A0A0R3UJG4_MESCO|nr:unnamed protein product [Mesocestoides corti]